MSAGAEASDEEKLAAFAEAVRAYNEEGDESFLDQLSADVVLATAREWPGGGIFRGRDDTLRFLREFREAWSSIVFEYDNPQVVGERVICAARWVATGHESEIDSVLEFFAVTSFEGGAPRRVDVLFGREDALECARTGKRRDWE